jgi:predicted DNA-binding transcriptional regulator YafY
MQDFTYWLPAGSGGDKTRSRDIALLRDAGVRIVFSRKEKSYSLVSRERAAPKFPASEPGQTYLEKLIRLITMMDDMADADDPAVWYKETFPHMSKRTMQRDFATLNSIGYVISYNRDYDWITGKAKNKYECEWPKITDGADFFGKGYY